MTWLISQGPGRNKTGRLGKMKTEGKACAWGSGSKHRGHVSDYQRVSTMEEALKK